MAPFVDHVRALRRIKVYKNPVGFLDRLRTKDAQQIERRHLSHKSEEKKTQWYFLVPNGTFWFRVNSLTDCK